MVTLKAGVILKAVATAPGIALRSGMPRLEGTSISPVTPEGNFAGGEGARLCRSRRPAVTQRACVFRLRNIGTG